MGKSSLALEWAEKNDAEILSCDSIALYKGMNIGSAKPEKSEQDRVPHHGIDLHEVGEATDVGRFADFAKEIVQSIFDRGKTVLVVGGSGFYLHSFLAPVVDEVVVSPQIRGEIESLHREEGIEALLARLESLNPQGLGGLDRLNPRRVIRALERCVASGKTLRELRLEFEALPKPFSHLQKKIVWLDRENEDLEKRISQRTERMLEDGLLEEVETLLSKGLESNRPASSSIGYREAIACLKGEIEGEELKTRIDRSTRRLVFRQRKWFRKFLPEGSRQVVPQDSELSAKDLGWVGDS